MTRTRVHLYHDPNTSEASGEWDTFLEAFCSCEPQSGQSRIVSNGETLARVWFDGPRKGWEVTSAGIARLNAERGRGPFGEPLDGPSTYTTTGAPK